MTKTLAILAFAAVLTLSACGKKGPLDPPPEKDKNASLTVSIVE